MVLLLMRSWRGSAAEDLCLKVSTNWADLPSAFTATMCAVGVGNGNFPQSGREGESNTLSGEDGSGTSIK